MEYAHTLCILFSPADPIIIIAQRTYTFCTFATCSLEMGCLQYCCNCACCCTYSSIIVQLLHVVNVDINQCRAKVADRCRPMLNTTTKPYTITIFTTTPGLLFSYPYFSTSPLFSSLTRRRFYPHRYCGLAVVTGAVPSPRPVRAFVNIAHRGQHSHCWSFLCTR